MNWFFSNLSPHPHVILHAGLARSCRIQCCNKRRKIFSLGRWCTPNGWGVGESFFVWTSPTVCEGHPSPGEREISFGRMDSATSPSASRRMTGWEANCEGWKFKDQRSQPKGNLLLWALILDWFMSFLNSILKCNFTSRQEGWASEESAPFNPRRKRGTDKNLQPTHLTLISFCTEGLPGVAEPTVSISHRIPFKVYKL